jgi:hypothetical protein
MASLLSQNADSRSRDFAVAEPGLNHRDESAPKNAWRTGFATLAALAGMALALRAGDAMSGWIAGVPRGVHVCASLQEAETRTGLQLGAVRRALGGYAVAANGIRATARPIQALAISMRGGEGANQLTLFQSRGGAIPLSLRAPLPSFHEITVPIQPGRTGSLKAERQSDGSVWQDLEWSDDTGTTALRWSGRTVELLRLARRLVEDRR